MRKYFLILTIVIVGFRLPAQELSKLREKTFVFLHDTIKIDSLSLVPGSVSIFTNYNIKIPEKLYTVNYPLAIITFSKIINEQKYILREKSKLIIRYRVLPYFFGQKYYNRDISILTPEIFDARKAALRAYYNPKEDDFFSQDILNKRGSISRGISIGNTSDVSVSSNLNLQLSGKINNNFEILAAISDNNIPIQPEGNSQNIREFDKVYLNIFNDRTSITAGDFELEKPSGNFLNMYKKVQGVKNTLLLNPGKNNKIILKTTTSAAVSKGKYNRMFFAGQEGNQGPYKLYGSDNERYIIVLAGTEKVYINGKSMKRGQDQDFIINYNTAEITFTPNQPITKDKRITIEFEYSDKNYARFLLYNSSEIKTEKSNLYFNIFSESDAKNQPVSQSLDANRRRILSLAGDNLESAVYKNIDSLVFSNDFVLYKMVDSTVNNVPFDTVFVYSINPDSAFYRLTFSLVGNNKGNYILDKTAANGSVYKWIAPVEGIPGGNYEPVVRLISPVKTQMIVAGGESLLGKSSRAGFEFAVSNHDKNTFSGIDDQNNIGYAVKLSLENTSALKQLNNINFLGSLNYRLISSNFNPVERIRDVEFERDWNLEFNNFSENEHLINLFLKLSDEKQNFVNYEIDYLNMGRYYRGIRNNLAAFYNKNGLNLNVDGSLLSSDDLINNTTFSRHNTNLSKSFSFIRIGIGKEGEKNVWKNAVSDSLLDNSFEFNQWEVFLMNADSSTNSFKAYYRQRTDWHSINNDLTLSSVGKDINISTGLERNPDHRLKTSLNYRNLEIKKRISDNLQDENSITARVEYFFRLFNGSISSSTFFETGSGLEYKKEFSYIEVNPGQGIYTWKDYNNNNIKELNEFETAKFRDQASYIRIYKPGQETVKIYNNQFNQLINLRPAIIWRKNTGIKKFLSKFSNNFAYKIDRNTSRKDYLASLNPFGQSYTDSSLISLNSSLRNTLSFNRSNAKFGVDFVIQDNRIRNLLVNGFDTRINTLKGSRLRLKIGQNIHINNNTDIGSRYYNSEYFSSKNYNIDYFKNELIINYQAGLDLRFGLNYSFNSKNNTLEYESSTEHKIGSEIMFSKTRKGNISARMNYIRIVYAGETNTSVSYIMLEGLLPGNNATWELIFQKSISETLILNINYFGRFSQGGKVIHTGNISLRASF